MTSQPLPSDCSQGSGLMQLKRVSKSQSHFSRFSSSRKDARKAFQAMRASYSSSFIEGETSKNSPKGILLLGLIPVGRPMTCALAAVVQRGVSLLGYFQLRGDEPCLNACAKSLEGKRVLRACVYANAAIDASVGVDFADVVDRKRLLRALVHTDAASDAIVGVDVNCHDNQPFSSWYFRKSPLSSCVIVASIASELSVCSVFFARRSFLLVIGRLPRLPN